MRKTRKGLLFFSVILILVLVLVYSGLRILESTVLFPEEETVSDIPSKTITRDGKDYFPRQDITVMLLLGIDELGPAASSGYFRNHGEADTVALLILDHKNETCSVLNLNRDTMVEMPVLGMGSRNAGSTFGQLALSHTYGEGLQDSCENAKATVSGFLGGICIDHYVALRMDAISIITDAVGGVTVTVTDDFSQVDSTIAMGQVTLTGSQAVTFVQTRRDVGSQMNLSRMDRHRTYMEGFLEALREKAEDSTSFFPKVYEDVSPYMVTDCSANVFSDLMGRCVDYPLVEIVTPEGENVMGEEYFEFYADPQKLDELILRLFYAPK